MHHAWNSQLPILADAYLHWKHIGQHDFDTEPDLPAHQFHISAVDPVRVITQHNEEAANAALVCVGLLGCSPTMPSVAITLQCLEFYHQLRQCQSSFSIQAFTKVLCTLHDTCFSSPEQFSNAFDIYLAILREIQSCTDTTLGQTKLNWHLRHSCPACTLKKPDEPTLYLESSKAMDGNNSAKRMAIAGHLGERGTDSDTNNPLACTDNWKAANSTNENTASVFQQTGIFLSACRHRMIQTITEM
ncbi:hypothetical protein DFH29DRAFT_805186 [Suillus ampliporus]|nr:hypothetical protein DFH29DRAFT_805186 [Suillus ampliporus]